MLLFLGLGVVLKTCSQFIPFSPSHLSPGHHHLFQGFLQFLPRVLPSFFQTAECSQVGCSEMNIVIIALRNSQNLWAYKALPTSHPSLTSLYSSLWTLGSNLTFPQFLKFTLSFPSLSIRSCCPTWNISTPPLFLQLCNCYLSFKSPSEIYSSSPQRIRSPLPHSHSTLS